MLRQLPWFTTLQVGDVIARPGGPWRVVRAISRRAYGLYAVTLLIRRCSWTGRCYTILNATDLRVQGYKPVRGAHWPCRTAFDRRVHKAITDDGVRPYPLRCCDVVGIP